MKRFLIRAGAKIGRFFWSWGFLKFILWSVTIVVLLYAEEDWRGARAWAATKAEWEAKGESLDYAKFIPPPIPDSQNLGVIPLFKLEPSSKTDPNLQPYVLQKALRSGGNDFPQTGNWQAGAWPDLEELRRGVASNYATVFKGGSPLPNALAQWEALYPFLPELRAAAATRPLCYFPQDNPVAFQYSGSLGLLTSQFGLSRVLTVDAVLALNQNRPDLALEDIRTNFKLMSGARHAPLLAGGLVAIGMNAIGGASLYNGLALHAWNDSQLAEIDAMLKPVNFLADHKFDVQCEAVGAATSFDSAKTAHPSDLYEYFRQSNIPIPLAIRAFPMWPSGWQDDNKSQAFAFRMRLLGAIDPLSRRVFPQVVRDLQKQKKLADARWDATAPWNFWFTLAGDTPTHITRTFSQGQFWVDETRIAIALERYRLAHGVHPESLEGLAPIYISELPHDIINGEPYHYQLRPDGTFLLYSIGWNEKDDGGKIVHLSNNPNGIDYDQGDWVWPTPQIPNK